MADDSVIVDVGLLERLREVVDKAAITLGPASRAELIQDIDAALNRTPNEPERIGLPTDEQYVMAAKEVAEDYESFLDVPDAPIIVVEKRSERAFVQAWIKVSADMARSTAE